MTGISIMVGNFHTGVALTGLSIGFGGGGIPAGIDSNVLAIKNELEFNLLPTFRHIESLTFTMEASIKSSENMLRGFFTPGLQFIGEKTIDMVSLLQQIRDANIGMAGHLASIDGKTTPHVAHPAHPAHPPMGSSSGSSSRDSVIRQVKSAIRDDFDGLRSQLQNL